MTLDELRGRWNDILDCLERTDRIAWIAFFDARLASLENGQVLLDFSDARKFGGAHEYAPIRTRHIELLEAAIADVTGEALKVAEL